MSRKLYDVYYLIESGRECVMTITANTEEEAAKKVRTMDGGVDHKAIEWKQTSEKST